MTYLTEVLDSPVRTNWKREHFYPNYPTPEEREEAREALFEDLTEVNKTILDLYDTRFTHTLGKASQATHITLKDFRDFLLESGFSKSEAIVYPQITSISKYFSKHYGGVSFINRVRCELVRLAHN